MLAGSIDGTTARLAKWWFWSLPPPSVDALNAEMPDGTALSWARWLLANGRVSGDGYHQATCRETGNMAMCSTAASDRPTPLIVRHYALAHSCDLLFKPGTAPARATSHCRKDLHLATSAPPNQPGVKALRQTSTARALVHDTTH